MIVEIDSRRFAGDPVPLKDESPLLVHTYRMQSGEIASEFLEVIAWRHSQVGMTGRVVEHLELSKESVLEIGRSIP